MKDIEWRGWQMDLRQYHVIEKLYGLLEMREMKEKHFFQANIREEFGYSRV